MAFKGYGEESDSELELVSNPMSRPILPVLNVESLRRYVIGLFAPMVKGGKMTGRSMDAIRCFVAIHRLPVSPPA